MHPQHPREGRRRRRIASVNSAADDQRLDREQQCCEQQPDTEHQMHPPIAYVDEAVVATGTFPYSARACYAGIGEFSVYVAREYRGRGAGHAVLAALIEAATDAGLHKLTSRVFPENIASRALLKDLGFAEIGIHRRHGKLDGVWRDCVIVERLLEMGDGEHEG